MPRSLRIRSGDIVQIVGGKDRGKKGKVLRVEPAKQRLYVEGLNMHKHHERPRTPKDAQRKTAVGGVVEKEGPIHISNVMLLDPETGTPTRVGVRRDGGSRVRVAKKSGKEIGSK